jgi:outer membrane protein assembly factor BamB
MDNGDNLWKFPTQGAIHSSPAVAENLVYFGSSDDNIYAISTENGKLGWSYLTEGPVQASPAVTDNKVFITSQDGYIYALDAKSGGLIWKHYIGATGSASPAAAYGKIFVGTSDGKLYCFGSWGSVPGGDVGKGIFYLFIAALLILILWGFIHLKPPKPKRTRKKRK